MQYRFNVENYSLEKTLLSGQAFRWDRKGDEFVGIIGKSILSARQLENGIIIEVLSGDISKQEIEKYFNINYAYEEMLKVLSKDALMARTLKSMTGYRILHQDPSETLFSFIDSANNSIVNIRKQIEKLSELFGEKFTDEYYAFPSIEKLATLNEDEIRCAGVGFRGKYMIQTAKRILTGDLLNELNREDSKIAHEKLTELPGVGDKIADCVLLFAYNRYERVPIDVWTRKVFCKFYGCTPKAKYEDLQNLAYDLYGEYAGYAFSYLFEAMRMGLI